MNLQKTNENQKAMNIKKAKAKFNTPEIEFLKLNTANILKNSSPDWNKDTETDEV